MGLMGFLDHLTLSIATGTSGVQDPDTGAWSAGAYPDTTLYDDAADVQDVGLIIGRTPDGLPVMAGDATAFLRDESVIPFILAGDMATVTFRDGTTQTARVAKARRLDGVVALEWLR